TTHFFWETWRVFWPLVTCLLIAYWFEDLREQYDGADWLRTLAKLNHVALGIIAGHVAWSTLFPYVKMRTLMEQKPEQFKAVVLARALFYGLVTIALAFGLSLILVIAPGWHDLADAHKGHDHIPPAAEHYRYRLTQEVRFYMGVNEPVSRMAAQTHQESAWRAGICSRFACGLSQFTEATAKDMARMYPKDLEGRSAPLDPAWALRAQVLYMNRLRAGLANFGEDAHAAALVGYNGGSGWLLRERKACALHTQADCDPQRWFGHVEHHCLRAKWACEENRDYPRKILFRWEPLYRKAGW
ncbi:MAG: transglycosylase SLT domain-containing protein, partial [Acidobacteria bacterium]|nr:transglycosylase SLT domain-containing protein [Acidobacteriota bacterium]